MIQRDTISDVASNIWLRISWLGLKVAPDPLIIAQLIIQLLNLLFAKGCYPTPQAATAYVNNPRYFRTLRISRMTRRVLAGIKPDYPPETVEAVVKAVLLQCRSCSVQQMTEYHRTIKNLRDSKGEGKALPEQL